ncbi:MAG: hypothetical protein RMA76_46140 [Deltaproteobacteria bacterium]
MRVGSRPLETLRTGDDDPATPRAAEPLRLPDAPRTTGAAKSNTKPRSTSGVAAFMTNALRRFDKAAAAVMIGALPLPALAGGPLLAEDHARFDPEVRIEAHVLPWRAAGGLAGSVDARDVFQAHLTDRLRDIEAQRAQFLATAPPDPVVRTDLLRLSEVVRRFDRMVDGARLPPNLLADMDRVLDAIEAARPGVYTPAIDLALLDLPSVSRVEVGAPTIPAADLTAILDASPTDLPDQMAAVLASYSAIMSNADAALNVLPGFTYVSPVPLFYDSGDGVLLVPPGATVESQNGQFSIHAPQMFWRQDGLLVAAEEGTVHLGSELDGLTASTASAQGDDWSAVTEDFVAGVRRDDGYGVIAARRMDLDLASGSAHLEDAELVVADTGDAELFAGALDFSAGNRTLSADTLTATQTRDGTTASAAHIAFGDGVTSISGSAVDLHFGPNGATLSGERLDITNGTTRGTLEGARASLRPTDDGHDLAFVADRAHFEDGVQTIDLSGADANASFDADGHLTALDGRASSTNVTTGAGAFIGTNGAIAARFDRGTLTAIDASTATGQWTGTDGTVVAASDAGLALAFDDGRLRQATLASGALHVVQGDHDAALQGLDLNVAFDEAGHLDEATGRAARLDYRNTDGTLVGAGDVRLNVDATGGVLDRVQLAAGQLDYQRGAESLAVTNGTLVLDAEGGRVTHAVATFDAATYEAGFGRLALAGTSLSIDYTDDGTTFHGFAEHLDLANDGGRLLVDGGAVNGSLRPDGTLEALGLSGDHLAYTGTTEGDHPLVVDLASPSAVLTALDGGGQRLDFTTGAGHFEVDGHRVALEGLELLTLTTTPDGEVDTFAADFDGQLDFVQRGGDLTVLTRDVETTYDRATSTLTLDFAEADVALRSAGLQARIEGAHGELDDSRVFISVDRAEVLRDLGEQLNVEVESLTVEATRTATGALQTLDLSLASLDADIAGIHAIVRTPDGERLRLHIGTDESGQTVQHAYLLIPEGGEVRLTQDDDSVRLGGQLISYTLGDDGIYRLRGESLDLEARTKDFGVRVEGGDAQVSLDPATGRLTIDEITGTRIDVNHDDLAFTIDVEAMNDFMVRATRLSGGATGLAFHLEPTRDGSSLTAFTTGEVGGLPFTLGFSNVHELEGLGAISENQVHAYLRDPSGRGHIELGFGPLEMSGSALEFVGRYHPYDAGRMLETVQRYTTLAGTEVFSGLSFDHDGVVRLGTDREGLNAELAVVLPRQYALPGYRFAVTDQPAAAPGVIGSVGWRHEDFTFSVFGGLVPGAHATGYVKEGDASLFGVGVPDRFDLPATVIGGGRVDLGNFANGDLSVVAGGYYNPASAVDSPFLNEPTAFGAFGGLEYRDDDGWFVNGSAVADFDRGGTVQGGAVMLMLGAKF